jgi:hypothetical protein
MVCLVLDCVCAPRSRRVGLVYVCTDGSVCVRDWLRWCWLESYIYRYLSIYLSMMVERTCVDARGGTYRRRAF